MKIHKLKLLIHFCDDVLNGEKNFEIRENDRGYQKGDYIKFTPVYDSGFARQKHPIENKEYEITYVLNGWGLENGYVAFGIREVQRTNA